MKKAKKKPVLWLSRNEDDMWYNFWSKEPIWKPKHKQFWGSKSHYYSYRADNFCPDVLEKLCPHLKLKGGEKAPIRITMGKIIRAN